MKRGQISYEYLIIIAIGMLFIIPVIYVFFSYHQESNDRVVAQRTVSAGQDLIAQARTVYLIGQGARNIVDVNFPRQLINATLDGGGGPFNGSNLHLVLDSGSSLITFSTLPMKFGSCCGHPHPDSFFAWNSSAPQRLYVESCGDVVAIYEHLHSCGILGSTTTIPPPPPPPPPLCTNSTSTEIASCGFDIITPGEYVIVCPIEVSSGICINITANDVALSGPGVIVNGSVGTFIHANGVDNLTLRNMMIDNYSNNYTFRLENIANSEISHITASRTRSLLHVRNGTNVSIFSLDAPNSQLQLRGSGHSIRVHDSALEDLHLQFFGEPPTDPNILTQSEFANITLGGLYGASHTHMIMLRRVYDTTFSDITIDALQSSVSAVWMEYVGNILFDDIEIFNAQAHSTFNISTSSNHVVIRDTRIRDSDRGFHLRGTGGTNVVLDRIELTNVIGDHLFIEPNTVNTLTLRDVHMGSSVFSHFRSDGLLVIENSLYGNVTYPHTISGSGVYTDAFQFGDGWYFIDESLPLEGFNKSATVSLLGNFGSSPSILRNGAVCDDCIIQSVSESSVVFTTPLLRGNYSIG